MSYAYKSLLACLSVISISLLSACSMAPPMPKHEHHLKEHGHQPMPPQDQAFIQAFKHACDGQNAGAMMQVKVDDRVIEGQCQLHFQPKPPQP